MRQFENPDIIQFLEVLKGTDIQHHQLEDIDRHQQVFARDGDPNNKFKGIKSPDERGKNLCVLEDEISNLTLIA